MPLRVTSFWLICLSPTEKNPEPEFFWDFWGADKEEKCVDFFYFLGKQTFFPAEILFYQSLTGAFKSEGIKTNRFSMLLF